MLAVLRADGDGSRCRPGKTRVNHRVRLWRFQSHLRHVQPAAPFEHADRLAFGVSDPALLGVEPDLAPVVADLADGHQHARDVRDLEVAVHLPAVLVREVQVGHTMIANAIASSTNEMPVVLGGL